jgi:hypothetical protein
MGVLLQGFFKISSNNAVPSPADGKPGVPWWWDHIAAQAKDFSLAGFTAIWLPPMLKAGSGAGPDADGYGPFDDYDIGSKKQKETIPTRFGTREQLQRCAAILRANGLDIYLDMVEHHRSGDSGEPSEAFIFRYLGANGTANIGRFKKDPKNFLPQVPRDPDLGGSPSDDFPFGRELAPINAKPHHYVFDGLIDASDWLTRALDAQGYRLDDVKGLSTDFLLPYLNSKAMAGKFAVGEFFSGVVQLVNQWVFNPRGMQGRPSVFDFPLKFILNDMCNNPGRFNMALLDHAGLAGISPLNAVTFVENHDTDTAKNNSQNIITNKLMGYAYILTSEGYPSVYYRDYSTDPNCFGLKPQIDNLIWIHEMLASGTTQQRWKDLDVFAYEREGGPRLLVALNNDPNGPHTIQVATGFGANVHLKDYTGHGGDVFTDSGGGVTIQVPANVNGLGYVCYSRVGQDRPLATTSHAVTQDFEGAADLDLLPAMNGKTISPGRIFCAANSSVKLALTVDRTGWTAASKIDVSLEFPDKTQKTVTITSASPAGEALSTTTAAEEFYTLQLTATGMPAANLNPPYKLSATYTAAQTFVAVHPVVSPAVAGEWSKVFSLKNVPIHAHLLPTGKVLYWGRRTAVGSPVFATLNDHHCDTYLWDPADSTLENSVPTKNSPTLPPIPPTAELPDGKPTVNLFCSGHAVLPDGRVMVVGGHLFDSEGVNQSCIYDPVSDTWTPNDRPNFPGRWYPSAITLPSGGLLALSGSFSSSQPQPPPDNPTPPPAGSTFPINPTPQVWLDGTWRDLEKFNSGLSTRLKADIGDLPLFPKLHIEPKQGHVFMSGALGRSYFLDPVGGLWSLGPPRDGANRDYAPSVMYESGKVIFIGGGLDGTGVPFGTAETIDLNDANPQWKPTASMHFKRRQHNATVLPDGTVLVTGGTGGVPNLPPEKQFMAFDNLTPGIPIHMAELWDPATEKWTVMAEEAIDRCYHSTAVLLPDGRVLSGGGGEYNPGNPSIKIGNPPVTNPQQANPPGDSHPDAQLYSPPYLFKGPRPKVLVAPVEVSYAQTFDVSVDDASPIAKVSWIRLTSVTHSSNQNQVLIFLAFSKGTGKITVTAPASANIAPPGHYMLFLVSEKGVPSIGHIAHISDKSVAAAVHHGAFALFHASAAAKTGVPETLAAPAALEDGRRQVVVGVTPTCPYGISACWAGAHDGLNQMSGIEQVWITPNGKDSTAFVYLEKDTLPDIDLWRMQFASQANGSYGLRGIELTLAGEVTETNGLLTLSGNETRAAVTLAPLQASSKVQWDFQTRENWPMTADEETAYERLSAKLVEARTGAIVEVTGPLKKNGKEFYVEVRTATIDSVAV